MAYQAPTVVDTVAMPTGLWPDRDDRIDPLGRHHRTTMAGMPRLAPGLPAALLPTAPLAGLARQPIGRGWFRRRRRVVVAQGELPFQLRDLAIALRDFFAELLNLALQLLDFARLPAARLGGRLRTTRSFGARTSRWRGTHAPYGTLVMSACTA